MKKVRIAIILISIFLPAIGLGGVTGDYSDNLSELRSIQDRWNDLQAGTNLSQGNKDAVGEQISTLIRWLELGEDAGKLGISDRSIRDAAAQLAGSAVALSVNSLLTGFEAFQVESDLNSVARRLLDKAETADLLSRPIEFDRYFGGAHLGLLQSGACEIELLSRRVNPESAIRFADFDIHALAVPSGGTLTWAFVRTIVTDRHLYREEKIEDTVVFGTSPDLAPPAKILRNGSLDGEVLPFQRATGEMSGLDITRQIVKGVGLSSPVPKVDGGWRRIYVLVRYDAPDGTSCHNNLSLGLDESQAYPFVGQNLFSEKIRQAIRDEGWPGW